MKHIFFLIVVYSLVSITHVSCQETDKAQKPETPPQDYVEFDKAPVVVKQAQTHYPDSALKAGLEGTVVVKLWVTTEGKVKQVVVLKSDATIFNQAAIEAAQQWVFTPALQKKKPVDVWVAIPFKFRLNDAKGH